MADDALETVGRVANDVPIVFGKDCRLMGCLDVAGDLHLHGTLDGEVRAHRVIIAPSARIAGTIIAREAIINGRVADGYVFAERIELGAGCNVTAELHYTALNIQPGSYFEGKSRRSENPRALAPKPFETELDQAD